MPPTVKLTADRSADRANPVFGWVFAGHQLGAAFVANGAGFSRIFYETYLPAFFVAGLLCLIAAPTIIVVRERRHALATNAA